MHDLRADVTVLTEPPASYTNGGGVVTSPPFRHGSRGHEAWIAIVGPSVEPLQLGIPFERLAVAARANVGGRTVIVYGAVLPWRAVTSHAPYLVRDGENSLAVFKRVLSEQAADIARLRSSYGDPVIWAGDFNQSVTGPNLTGSAEGRAALTKTLAELGYSAWNGASAHAVANLCSVDLVCGPSDLKPVRQGRIDPASGGVAMSDHAGYWIEFEVRR